MNPYYQDDSCTIYHKDCLSTLPVATVADLVLSDPPYGLTSNRWDAAFDLAAWWKWVGCAATDTAAIVLCAGQPFTSRLVASNYEQFRHEWVWIKNAGSNFANTVREPMKEHESILVFSAGNWTYNPQFQSRTGGGEDRVKYGVAFQSKSENYREFEGRDAAMQSPVRVPSSWQKWNRERGLHPTQKPLAMMRYFIKTYSNPGDTVLDPFMGSGTTLRAAKDLGRKAIGVEIEEHYCEIAAKRLGQEVFAL